MDKTDFNYQASVLIVDDNPKNLQVLAGVLSKEGLELEYALDGIAALEWIEKKVFDLILLDVMMPGMDGFEVCRIIQQDYICQDIPIIFITAKTDSESIIKGFETGGVDYITKPFISKELIARVKTQINIKKSKKKILQYLSEIEIRNRNILDSIEYARHIQKTVLNASLQKIGDYPENFILIIPKDIVSGDFYWYYKIDNEFLLAVMDCTGHGVPGAFMSILGTTLLNEIVTQEKIYSPEKILGRLRVKIIESLGQNNEHQRVRDGMEGILIKYCPESSKLDFAGSFRPLILLRDNIIRKVDADRLPIGYFEQENPFTLCTLDIEKGDVIYLSTDGYQDQFGQMTGTRIMSKGFIDLLTGIHTLPMELQKNELSDFLRNWKGNLEQTDDILVVGMRF